MHVRVDLRWTAVFLAVLGGCDVVFGLANEGSRVCANPGTTIGLTVLADATLDGASALGTNGTLRVDGHARVLLRLRGLTALDRLSLHLAIADYGTDCQASVGGCSPCPASSLGTVDVYIVNNEWDEATVTGDERQPGVPWRANDRILAGTAAFGPTGALRLDSLDLATVATTFGSDEIAVELVGTHGTDARFASREGNECSAAAPPDAAGSCESVGVCGDQAVGPGEDCDGTAGCAVTCEASACGDGIVDTLAGEECDDGNYVNASLSSGDECDRNCKRSACGNGLVTGSEQCDDADPTAPPGLICSGCIITGFCGNGTPDGDERCDDGNQLEGDGCDSNCTPTSCNNGIRTGAEECDDGNFVNGDACDINCTLPRCGNGAVDPSEECDDGNRVPNDGCNKNCLCEVGGCPAIPL